MGPKRATKMDYKPKHSLCFQIPLLAKVYLNAKIQVYSHLILIRMLGMNLDISLGNIHFTNITLNTKSFI